MPDSIHIELQFLPCLDYFLTFLQADKIYLEGDEHFQKQTYRNRAHLLGPHQVIVCTVPIRHRHGEKIKIKEVEIDYSQPWGSSLIRTIRSCYGKSPYFEYYFDGLEKILRQKCTHLWELNIQLLTFCLKSLKIDKDFIINFNFQAPEFKANKNLLNIINPKKNPYNKDILQQLTYKQTFGKDFVNNLSIMDIIFCEGPHASVLLHQLVKPSQLNANEQILQREC